MPVDCAQPRVRPCQSVDREVDRLLLQSIGRSTAMACACWCTPVDRPVDRCLLLLFLCLGFLVVDFLDFLPLSSYTPNLVVCVSDVRSQIEVSTRWFGSFSAKKFEPHRMPCPTHRTEQMRFGSVSVSNRPRCCWRASTARSKIFAP